MHLRFDNLQEFLQQIYRLNCFKDERERSEGGQNMKKFTAVLCALAMTMGLAACATQAAPDAEAPAETVRSAAEPIEADEADDTVIVGGWKLNTEFSCNLSEEELGVFSNTMEGLTGAGYQPVDILAVQTVSGTNYAYLSMAATITAETRYFWTVVVIYEDPEGNVTLSGIKIIDKNDIKTLDEAPEDGLAGAWEIREAGGKPVMLPDPDAQEAAESVMHAVDGLTLKPIALLGTQVVSGMNYKVLMRGESENGTDLYVTTIYRNLEGRSMITENSLFDLMYYVTFD